MSGPEDAITRLAGITGHRPQPLLPTAPTSPTLPTSVLAWSCDGDTIEKWVATECYTKT